ncbi:MAG: hypothetical protein JXB88_00580, partial [Spirochaetales bacterium]|nr:hypothetical protein [Spirochaetales bacterium]
LFYFILRRYFDFKIIYPFFLLLVSSPWYLSATRSAIGVGFGMSLIILCLSMLVLLHKSKNWVLVPVLTGISIALLPYGYANAKHLPVLFIIWILINIKKLKVRRVLIVMAAVLLCIIPQFFDIKQALYNYNRSDGDPLTFNWQFQKDPLGYILMRVWSNIQLQVRALLGIMDNPGTWDGMVAQSFYKKNDIYYPRFLVPLFVFGLVYSVYRFFRYKKKDEGVIFLFFLASFIPGLASGGGNPNPARDYLMILPLYYYITLSFYFIFDAILKAESGLPLLRLKILNLNFIQLFLYVLLSITFLFTNIFQPINYFGYKDRQYDAPQISKADILFNYINDKLKNDANSSFLVYSPDRILGLYTIIRFYHSEEIGKFIKSGQLYFHYGYAIEKNKDLIKNGKIKYLISLPGLEQEIMPKYGLDENQIIHSAKDIIVFSTIR